MTTTVQPELDYAAALAFPWPPSKVDFRREVAGAVMAVAWDLSDVHVSMKAIPRTWPEQGR